MTFGIKPSNMHETKRQMDKFVDEIRRVTVDALREMERVSVRFITDNTFWSDRAIYKTGPQRGQKYDLDDSGQLLRTISSEDLNFIFQSSKSVSVGIGNINSLDSLRSSSTRQGNNPDGRYWRLAVYGRKTIHGWKFVQTGEGWAIGKARGYSEANKTSVIAPSEPTMMFENGFRVAKATFPEIMKKHLKSATNNGK